MTQIEFLNLLTKYAKDYRLRCHSSVVRNQHMHGVGSMNVTQKEIDAILVDFINAIAAEKYIDYGLYAKDIQR